jgi:hypothetical protein
MTDAGPDSCARRGDVESRVQMKRSLGVRLIGGLLLYWSVFVWAVLRPSLPASPLHRAINLAHVVMAVVTGASLLINRSWALKLYIAFAGLLLLDFSIDSFTGMPVRDYLDLLLVIVFVGCYCSVCFAVWLYLRSALRQ